MDCICAPNRTWMWPVARQERHRFAERPEFVADRIHQRWIAAARQIGATDAAVEQHVADQCVVAVSFVEHDVARRVSRTMNHVEFQLTHTHGVAVVEPTSRLERGGIGQTVTRALFAESLR